MSKVTSKLQITVPKAVAEQYGIRPGDEVDWAPAGDAIRLTPARRSRPLPDIETRLGFFDQATERQRERQESLLTRQGPGERGWTRDELYHRG